MSHLTGQERSRYVRRTFARIAPHYDLLNRLMAWGQDGAWRRAAIRKLALQPGHIILDNGTGTGDIALEIQKADSRVRVVGSDFTLEMVKRAYNRPGGDQISWVIADALCLPFAAQSFNGVICGYLLRNVPDLDLTLAEDWRILKPGGWNVSLDTTPPRRSLLKPVIEFYLNHVVPLLGRLFAGETEAYQYLTHSTEGFLAAEGLAVRFTRAGFEAVDFTRKMMDTMAIHWGRRP